jgi:uncharacterized surface protein with fasciclin (FAS1) repeats
MGKEAMSQVRSYSAVSLIVAMAFAVSLAGCGGEEPAAPSGPPPEKKKMGEVEPRRLPAAETQNIVQTAMAAEEFSTLCEALKAADLVEALERGGPYTVFAPTDEAFGKLPEGTLDELLKPESKDQLTGVLKHHVISGKMTATDVAGAESLTTISGTQLAVTVHDGAVMVGDAKVVQADIEASNGVIHAIDAVLLP